MIDLGYDADELTNIENLLDNHPFANFYDWNKISYELRYNQKLKSLVDFKGLFLSFFI